MLNKKKLPITIKLNQNRIAIISLNNASKPYMGYKLWLGDRYVTDNPKKQFNEYLYGTLIALYYQHFEVLEIDYNYFRKNANVKNLIGQWRKNHSIMEPLYKKALKKAGKLEENGK